MSDAPVFTAEVPGLLFTVFDDRIEATVKKRVQTIPLDGVAEVLVSRRPKKLVVVTNEGKRYQYLLGRETEPARGVIARRLAGGSPGGLAVS